MQAPLIRKQAQPPRFSAAGRAAPMFKIALLSNSYFNETTPTAECSLCISLSFTR